jgi:hypothetical protein
MTKSQITRLVDDEVGSRPEAAIDFLYAVAVALNLTAEHVRENWNDRAMGKAWDKCAAKVEDAMHYVDENAPIGQMRQRR